MTAAVPTALLVERDETLLKSMSRLLRQQLPEWRLCFVSDPRAAVNALEEGRPDVVVSDLCQPPLDGGAFLREVRRRQPQAVRILLTSDASDDDVADIADVAHQMLTKPLEVPKLGQAMAQAHRLGAILRDPELREMVVEDNCLPPAPICFSRLNAVLASANPSVEAVAEVLESDPALTSRVMQVAQSALFGMRYPPQTIRDAVVRLGLDLTRGLTLSLELQRMVSAPVDGLDLDAFAHHGVLTGMVMRRVAAPAERDVAFITGVVHGVGMLLLASRRPEIFASIAAEALETEQTLSTVLYERLGVSDAELGAYMLGIWRFPERVVSAIARQHSAALLAERAPDACDAVYLARRLVRDPDARVLDHPPIGSEALDRRFVNAWGGEARLAAWRHTARAVRDKAGD